MTECYIDAVFESRRLKTSYHEECDVHISSARRRVQKNRLFYQLTT